MGKRDEMSDEDFLMSIEDPGGDEFGVVAGLSMKLGGPLNNIPEFQDQSSNTVKILPPGMTAERDEEDDREVPPSDKTIFDSRQQTKMLQTILPEGAVREGTMSFGPKPPVEFGGRQKGLSLASQSSLADMSGAGDGDMPVSTRRSVMKSGGIPSGARTSIPSGGQLVIGGRVVGRPPVTAGNDGDDLDLEDEDGENLSAQAQPQATTNQDGVDAMTPPVNPNAEMELSASNVAFEINQGEGSKLSLYKDGGWTHVTAGVIDAWGLSLSSLTKLKLPAAVKAAVLKHKSHITGSLKPTDMPEAGNLYRQADGTMFRIVSVRGDKAVVTNTKGQKLVADLAEIIDSLLVDSTKFVVNAAVVAPVAPVASPAKVVKRQQPSTLVDQQTGEVMKSDEERDQEDLEQDQINIDFEQSRRRSGPVHGKKTEAGAVKHMIEDLQEEMSIELGTEVPFEVAVESFNKGRMPKSAIPIMSENTPGPKSAAKTDEAKPSEEEMCESCGSEKKVSGKDYCRTCLLDSGVESSKTAATQEQALKGEKPGVTSPAARPAEDKYKPAAEKMMGQSLPKPKGKPLDRDENLALVDRASDALYFFDIEGFNTWEQGLSDGTPVDEIRKKVEGARQRQEPPAIRIQFKDPVLKNLWDEEISGQLSDGAWEHDNRTDWLWSNATTELGDRNIILMPPGSRKGRSYFPDMYDELEPVHDRMLEMTGYTPEQLKSALHIIHKMIRFPKVELGPAPASQSTSEEDVAVDQAAELSQAKDRMEQGQTVGAKDKWMSDKERDELADQDPELRKMYEDEQKALRKEKARSKDKKSSLAAFAKGQEVLVALSPTRAFIGVAVGESEDGQEIAVQRKSAEGVVSSEYTLHPLSTVTKLPIGGPKQASLEDDLGAVGDGDYSHLLTEGALSIMSTQNLRLLTIDPMMPTDLLAQVEAALVLRVQAAPPPVPTPVAPAEDAAGEPDAKAPASGVSGTADAATTATESLRAEMEKALGRPVEFDEATQELKKRQDATESAAAESAAIEAPVKAASKTAAAIPPKPPEMMTPPAGMSAVFDEASQSWNLVAKASKDKVKKEIEKRKKGKETMCIRVAESMILRLSTAEITFTAVSQALDSLSGLVSPQMAKDITDRVVAGLSEKYGPESALMKLVRSKINAQSIDTNPQNTTENTEPRQAVNPSDPTQEESGKSSTLDDQTSWSGGTQKGAGLNLAQVKDSYDLGKVSFERTMIPLGDEEDVEHTLAGLES